MDTISPFDSTTQTAPNIIPHMEKVGDYLCTWNTPPSEHLASVIIEDETLRDGIQGPFVRRPTLDQKLDMLQHSVSVGTAQAMLGFPASSAREFDDCLALLHNITREKWKLTPHFLGRPLEIDLAPIAALQQAAECPVWAGFWINASPLRMRIENWNLPELHRRIQGAGRFLQREGLPYSVSFEDSTRTPPATLEALIRLCIDLSLIHI